MQSPVTPITQIGYTYLCSDYAQPAPKRTLRKSAELPVYTILIEGQLDLLLVLNELESIRQRTLPDAETSVDIAGTSTMIVIWR